MEEADVQNSNESGCTRIRVYKARNPRQYYGQTESLLQYLKSKNSSMDLDYMRQCIVDCNQVNRMKSSETAGKRKDPELSKLAEQTELGKACSLNCTSHISIDAECTNHELKINIAKYGQCRCQQKNIKIRSQPFS